MTTTTTNPTVEQLMDSLEDRPSREVYDLLPEDIREEVLPIYSPCDFCGGPGWILMGCCDTGLSATRSLAVCVFCANQFRRGRIACPHCGESYGVDAKAEVVPS